MNGARAAAGCARLLAAAALLGGCAAGPDGPGDGSSPAVAVSKTRISPGQTGLEVVTWQVTDAGTRLQDALRANAVPAVGGADEAGLRANGFLLAPVRADRLDELRDALGGSALDIRTWMGTATTWRELAAASPGDALLEVDGVARERPGSQVRLMARAWPLPMEDGTRIAAELVPQVVSGGAQASLVRNANRLAGEVVRSCALELEMEPGTAWVLTCDPGGFVELGAAGAAGAGEAEHGRESTSGSGSGKIAARVVTVGAATLLAAPERPGEGARRTVLVLVPHLGGSAFPADGAPKPMTGSRP